ncbi:MAG TPA: serine--tRNA ligase, partial [Woeseiaceae bacterium]|nr:serine--tRNA ligase [Woeseiaceae bacterium]
MIDPKTLRQKAPDVAANLSRRGFAFDADAYLALEEQRKRLQVEVEDLRSERNASAKKIGQAKSQGEDAAPLLAAVKDLGTRLEQLDGRLDDVRGRLRDIELGLPNLLHDAVPPGAAENDNQTLRQWGTPPTFDFEARDHVDLGTALGVLDLE